MSLPIIMSGLNGALGLYSSMKGVFDAADAAEKQKKLHKRAQAEEEGWFRRNYYGDFLDNTASRAAMKRVEDTLRRTNEQNRAYSAINGATPEFTLARNEQGLRTMENLVTGLAEKEDERKMRVDAMHRQNKRALLQDEYNMLARDEKNSAALAGGGLNLLHNALLGVEWGKEKHK